MRYPKKRAKRYEDPVESFMAKHEVDPVTGCWVWTACKDPDGYGMITVAKKVRRAMRWFYVYSNGPIREGLVIDHLCRNRACVNPEHLEVVTNRENQLRGIGFAGSNARKTHCPRGHELSGPNLEGHLLRRGIRSCRICSRERVKQQRDRRKDPPQSQPRNC